MYEESYSGITIHLNGKVQQIGFQYQFQYESVPTSVEHQDPCASCFTATMTVIHFQGTGQNLNKSVYFSCPFEVVMYRGSIQLPNNASQGRNRLTYIEICCLHFKMSCTCCTLSMQDMHSQCIGNQQHNPYNEE